MTRKTKFTFYSLLFLSQLYQLAEALPPRIPPSSNSTSNYSNLNPNHPQKLTKREESLIRKVITHELENKTVLNAVSNILSTYLLDHPNPPNPLLNPTPFNKKSLKQKYTLRKTPKTTTPGWDQSLEDFLTITTPKSTPSPSSSPLPTTPPDSIIYEPAEPNETTLESTSKKYVVLTLYAAPQPPSSLNTAPQPPQITTPLPPPPSTTLPWYKTAPNIFDPQQVGPIVTDLVVANINNGLIPNFLWNQAVDFAQGDGPRVTGILLECIFLPPCPT